MSRNLTRRQFAHTTAALGIGYWIADRAAAEGRSPNDRVAFACIGLEGKGRSDSDDAARLGDVVAVCDVDANYLGSARQRFPKARQFTDYRKLLDEMDKSIDVVTVSTPDHMRTPLAAAAAMRRGERCSCRSRSRIPCTKLVCWPNLPARIRLPRRWATRARLPQQPPPHGGPDPLGPAGPGERDPHHHRPPHLAAGARPSGAPAAARSTGTGTSGSALLRRGPTAKAP